MPKRKFVSDEAFVRAWNKSDEIAHVSVITGLTRNYIYARARELRKVGVKLPHFFPKQVVNVDKLNKIADEEHRKRFAP